MNTFHRWFCRSAYWKKALEERILPWALKGVELGDDVLEIGPGPGMTTEVLRQRFTRLTSVEVDHRLAESLKARMQGTNVKVVETDATAMSFADGSFSGAVSFTMLHHVPSPQLQDRLLGEVWRVLQPGAMFVGTDSTWSPSFQLAHLFDTMVVIDPESFGERLTAAGFTEVSVRPVKKIFSFRARRP
jgi:ubiquinone/menaquinone biosynthesis C-methylase UbiE